MNGHLDPVVWSFAPAWWGKQPLINARVETAATSRMFKPLWTHGRAIVFANAWYEWKKEGNTKQPYLIFRKECHPQSLAPAAARIWRGQNTCSEEADDIAREGNVPANEFTWYAVSQEVGNVKQQGAKLIEPVDNQQ
jgi:putative SOS response-associated peptidase YedK